VAHGKSDAEYIKNTSNLARFCVNNPAIAIVFLLVAMGMGFMGYRSMPQRKDPDIPVRQAAVQVPWPGNNPMQVELQVTKKIEDICASNKNVKKVESTVQPGMSITYIELEDSIKDAAKEFDDIGIKLTNAAPSLPQGAGPVIYIKDFGDTAALMLTVASPPYSPLEIEARARPISDKIKKFRAGRKVKEPDRPYTIVYCYPKNLDARLVQKTVGSFIIDATSGGFAHDIRLITGEGFLGIDLLTKASETEVETYLSNYMSRNLKAEEMNPDTWPPVVIQDPDTLKEELLAAAPDRYTYRQMDDFTRTIADGLRTVPSATSVDRKGALGEAIYLNYSQSRVAAYGFNPTGLPELLGARNIQGATGTAQADGQGIFFQTAGQFKNQNEIANVMIGQSNGAPVYLRDVVGINRSYKLPATYLNYLNWKDESGRWHRSQAVTLSVQMKPGQQISVFGKDIDAKLSELRRQVPSDLVIVRTSDQPRQVAENIELFNTALIEAVILVVLISLIGFWDWRSALLMALSIPVTLFMTYGCMSALGLDLQQVSIASLIIALGLLVDNPVVAGDAIKVSMASGQPSKIAAWLGPTKLQKAITFATLTNIAAYVPLAFLSGDTGKFLYSLPLVVGSSLICSVLVAQGFVPTIGRYLLRPQKETSVEEMRNSGFTRYYYRFANFCVHHRWRVVGVSLLLLIAGLYFASRLPTQMFPDDEQYISTVDVYLPNNANLMATNAKAREVEKTVIEVADKLGRDLSKKGKEEVRVLKTICTFLGGGGPRFWFSIQPEMSRLSYAQLVVECNDKHYTNLLVNRLMEEIPDRVAGVRIDVRKLQSGTSYKTPVELYLSGTDEEWKPLVEISGDIQQIYRKNPQAMSIRDDWGDPIGTVNLEPDQDKANLVGITNLDVARSTALAVQGLPVATVLEGQYSIPIIARLAPEERAQLTDLRNLYVYSQATGNKVLLSQVVKADVDLQPYYVQRRNFHRCIKPGAFPVPGAWGSDVFNKAWPEVKKIKLPTGYDIQVGGEMEKQQENFPKLARAMLMSVIGIFLCLVLQFNSAAKPFIVFAAVPFGMVGALAGLIATDMPFGFMAFLGIASLVGVIVSHIIVLFDYIEVMHEEGKPLMEAVIDAGLARLRPVLITVCATVFALFPLAAHGGPLWQPMCYAQIGGLTLATLVTLVLVPTIYCIFVLDLKIVKWEVAPAEAEAPAAPVPAPENPPKS
jgi:multidrug efflux pump subunit AcrB